MAKAKTNPSPIPPARFGKDHWSTFGYLCCIITSDKGVPDMRRLRIDCSRHPGFKGPMMRGFADGKGYPTIGRILPSGEKDMIENHDDIDCIKDLVAAGLVEWKGTGVTPVFALTKLGWKVNREMTEWKAEDRRFIDFVPSFVKAS
jgi:hypothetical protein